MTPKIALIGLLAIGLAAQNIRHYARHTRVRRERRRALQTWEGEGGAVPTGPSTIAAQVKPSPPSEAAPGR